MRRIILILLGCILFSQMLNAQTTVQHWETVVYDSMFWKYFPGTSDPGATWYQPAYDDQSWPQGRGSIGYGDNDDRTIISPVLSVFLRKKFTITNRSKIAKAVLHVDYDDGFIAYLNGVEIARAMMGSQQFVPFNQPSAGLHEALIYQGQKPEGFLLTQQQLDLLVNGENTLSIQVHNDNISSSDLTSAVFLSVGITDNSTTYLPTPSWFEEPLDFTSSNLPIVIINTGGLAIPNEPRINVDMGIIYNGMGVRNNLTDPHNNYSGKIGIELRGESSLYIFPKKSYRLETRNADLTNLNVSLLGMPIENDWILYAPYSDKSLMRNVITYTLGRDMKRYAARTRFVELVVNGIYEGVYVLMENIKVDANRVNIAPLKPADISGLQLTGGYLLRVDKIDGNDYPAWKATPTPMLAGEQDISFQYHDPKGEDMQPAQRNYIQSYMRVFQSSLTVSTFGGIDGFRRYLDVPAALDFMIVNEIGKNVDAYIFSTYLYKEKDKATGEGKLVMGPLWDFNLAYGNVDYNQNAQNAPGWIWNEMQRMFWFRRMLQDDYFANQFACRWEELRSTWMTNAYFTNKIDSIATVLGEAQTRNYQRWPVLGNYVWPNQYVGQTYAQEVSYLKTWLLTRLTWIDSNHPGNCQLITSIHDLDPRRLDVYPNPFKQSITIQLHNSFEIKRIKIFDVLGNELVNALFEGDTFQWNGIDDTGRHTPAGLYVLQLSNQFGVLEEKRIIRTEF